MAEGLGGLLDRWHALSEQDYNTERVKGTAFENLCKVYLENDPTEKELYSDVQSFGDWARERGEKATDIGIDLVARIGGGGWRYRSMVRSSMQILQARRDDTKEGY